jgi:hypothetical protein
MSDSESELHSDDECYWCGGDVADGGSIKVQMNEGEPKRETCPDCFRNWPPEEVENSA